MVKLLFFHLQVTNSKLLTRKLKKKKNLDLIQDLIIEMKEHRHA